MIGQDLIQNIETQSNTLIQGLNQKKWYSSQAEIENIFNNGQHTFNSLPEISQYYLKGILHQLNHQMTQPHMNDPLFRSEIKALKELFDYNLGLQERLLDKDLYKELADQELDNQRQLFLETNENVQNAIAQNQRLLSIDMLKAENFRLKALLENAYEAQDLPQEPIIAPEVREKRHNDNPKQTQQNAKSNVSIIDALIQFLSDAKKPNFNPISSAKNLIGGVLGFVFNLFSSLIKGMFGGKIANQFSDTAQEVFDTMATGQEQAPPRTKPAPTFQRNANPPFTPAFNAEQQQMEMDRDELVDDRLNHPLNRNDDNGAPLAQKMEL